MKYEKPEIVAIGSASESIQGSNMKGAGTLETRAPFQLTNGAYRADE